MRRLGLLLTLTALLAPGAAAGAGTFVVVDEIATLPGFELPNEPGAIAVDPSFRSRPAWVQQRSVGELMPLWQRAGEAYGIPWELLAAINKIETNFGQNMGPSSAGAVGWMQFMPDTWLRWGTDANFDGLADPWDPEDAVFSAARYLAAAGGQTDLPRAVFAYNHADWYVNEVLALASVYAGGSEVVPAFAAEPGVDLEAAQRAVAEASEALTRALARETALARREATVVRRQGRSQLLSDRLIRDKRLTQAAIRTARARTRTAELRRRLAEAEATLAAARAGYLATPFGLGSGYAAPSQTGGYAFPVGGGPAQVSVAATHHDYPAADIAAPMGAPVYAHEDAVVVRGWSESEGRCGIGFTMRASDGREWTYCHLSYLEPIVSTGALLTAGTPVGLVGSTGTYSTGPHLHLQLAPAVSYPQVEPWFRNFAGTAFSWIGNPPPGEAPKFAVIPNTSTPDEPAGRVVLFTQSS